MLSYIIIIIIIIIIRNKIFLRCDHCCHAEKVDPPPILITSIQI